MSGSSEKLWGKRWGNCSQWCRQNTHNIIKFTARSPHLLPQTTTTSRPLVTDHCNKHDNNEKVWNTMRMTKMWQRDVKGANAAGKMVPEDLFKARSPHTPSVCLKKKKYLQKHNSIGSWMYIFLDSRTLGFLASFPTSITFIIKTNFTWKTKVWETYSNTLFHSGVKR